MVGLKYKPRLISLNNCSMMAVLPKSLDEKKSTTSLKKYLTFSCKHTNYLKVLYSSLMQELEVFNCH